MGPACSSRCNAQSFEGVLNIVIVIGYHLLWESDDDFTDLGDMRLES